MKLNFGKYKGKLISEIPYDYRLWCFNHILDWIKERQPEFYDYLISEEDDFNEYMNAEHLDVLTGFDLFN